MDTKKKHFIKRANEIGILFIKERNSKQDLTGWGALEFILSNGEVFIVSGKQFGQGKGEDGLWIDCNQVDPDTLDMIRNQVSKSKEKQEENAISAWLKCTSREKRLQVKT